MFKRMFLQLLFLLLFSSIFMGKKCQIWYNINNRG